MKETGDIEVWVFTDDMFWPIPVFDAEGKINAEMWASTWGVKNYPNAIYFFEPLVLERIPV